MSREFRSVRLINAAGEIRTAKFENREHIVVPVIALVEGVIQAMNAPTPELVLAEEFGRFPGGWNGRPIMADHPIRNGTPVSANSPEVLEAECVGRIFNTHVKDNKLRMEAWIDVAMAERTAKGRSLLARAKSKQPIEVSVGVFTNAEHTSGIRDGQSYSTIWRDLVPDHLALLSEGSTGACSIEMGCGVRAARNQLTDEGGVIIVAEPNADKPKSLRERVRATFAELFTSSGIRTAEDVTANDLHNRLWDALYASEPGFAGIADIVLSSNEVVYATSPEQDKLMTFRRGYEVAEDGSVTLAGERVEVKRTTSWEPVAAAGAPPCGCGTKNASQTNNKEKEPMAIANQAERVKALCDSKRNNFSEETHGAFLRSCSEEQLKQLEETDAKLPEPKQPETPAVTETAKPAAAPAVAASTETKPVTVESYIASAPPEIQAVLNAGIRSAQAEKTTLVARIKAAKANPFTEEQLNAKSNEELRQLAAFAGVEPVKETQVSFAGRGAARPEQKDDNDEKPEPAPTVASMLAGAKK